MLTKLVLPGEKVEIESFEKTVLGDVSDKKAYASRVYDIIDGEQFEVLMPMEQTKLILLPVDGLYNICFYTKKGLYQACARVVDRYKNNNVYILLCELTTQLKKYQRREYYRFSCIVDMQSRLLDEEEIAIMEKDQIMYKEGQQMSNAVIVDISGGGIRFVTRGYHYEPGDLIYLTYTLPVNNGIKAYEISGKVLASKPVPDKKEEFEHRVQYMNIMKAEREEIIRYIFEEERKNRQRENGI